jgi:hypothetical protein
VLDADGDLHGERTLMRGTRLICTDDSARVLRFEREPER